MRELVRQIQTARKDAGLNVDNRISLAISSADDEIIKMLSEFEDIIVSETLAVDMNTSAKYGFEKVVVVDGYDVGIALSKA